MNTFWEWLRLQNLLGETYVAFDPKQYDELFDAIDRGITSQGRVFAKTRAFADLALKISGLA